MSCSWDLYNLIGDDLIINNCRAFNSRDGRVVTLPGLDSSRAAGYSKKGGIIYVI